MPGQTVFDSVQDVTSKLLTASRIYIAQSDELSFGERTKTELPDHVTVDSFLSKNCTENPANPTFSLSTSFQRSASITLQQSVTHTVTYGLSVTAKITDAFSTTGNVSFGESTSSGTANVTGSSTTVTTTRSGTQAVPADTFLVIELQTWPVRYTIPFSTSVLIDADLNQNDKGYVHLSELVDVAHRRFPISGVIEANDASAGELVFYNVTFDKTKCPSGSIKDYKPKKVTALSVSKE